MKLSVVTSRILRTQEFQKLRKGKYMKDKIQTVMKTALILFRQPCTVTLWNGVIFKYVVWRCPDSHQVFLTLPTSQIQTETGKTFSVAMWWYNSMTMEMGDCMEEWKKNVLMRYGIVYKMWYIKTKTWQRVLLKEYNQWQREIFAAKMQH